LSESEIIPPVLDTVIHGQLLCQVVDLNVIFSCLIISVYCYLILLDVGSTVSH